MERLNNTVLPTWEAATAEVDEILPRLSDHNANLVVGAMTTAANEMDALADAVASGPAAVRQSTRKAKEAVQVAQRVLESYAFIHRDHPALLYLQALEKQLTL